MPLRRTLVEARFGGDLMERIRALLAGCEHLSLGLRGREQLTPRTLEWIARRWELVTPMTETSLDLWRLRR